MNTVYDLHSHSVASDGSLTPQELVCRAKAQGVSVLALTDHDCTDGLAQAQQSAAEQGLHLVPGVEISVSWQAQTIHVVALGIDPANQTLQQGLRTLQAFRQQRAHEIAHRLQRSGIENAYQGASQYAKGALLSRTHFAHYIVELGLAKDMRDVFKRYLTHNKPGYVAGQWATMDEALAWIKGAGGQAVIAHPARYKMSATRMRQLLNEFKQYGGDAIEVVSSSHSRSDCLMMAQLCRRFSLLASCGSDFHSPDIPWAQLGRIAPLPEHCTPVWTDWNLTATRPTSC